MEDKIKSFHDECYLPATKRMLAKLQEELNTHSEEIMEQLNKGLDEYCERLSHTEEAIGLITLSFLYTSFYFNKPCLRLDAYGAAGQLGESYLEGEIEVNWLFKHWADYEQEIKTYIEENQLQHDIKEEQCYIMLLDSIGSMLYAAMIPMKYWADEWEGLTHLSEVNKLEQFAISFGAYKDWQRALYIEQPEIDLFHMSPETVTSFRKFEDKSYHQKAFKALDLKHCQFIRCQFRTSTFSEVCCDDAIFIDCQFRDVSWEKVSLKGASFVGCDFMHLKGEKIETGLIGYAPNEIKDLYKYAAFENCLFQEVTFEESNLSQVMLTACIDQGIKVKQSDVTASDFAAYLEE